MGKKISTLFTKKILLLILIFFSHTNRAVTEKWEEKISLHWPDAVSYVRDASFLQTTDTVVLRDWHESGDVIIKNISDENVEPVFIPNCYCWKPIIHPTGNFILNYPEKNPTLALSDITGKQINAYSCPTNEYVQQAQFNPHGTELLVMSNKACRVWDVENGKTIATYSHPEKTGRAAGYFYPPESILIASAHAKAVRWDMRSNGVIKYDHITNLDKVSIAPARELLAAICSNDNGTAWIYSLKEKKRKKNLPTCCNPKSVSFNKNGTHILTRHVLASSAFVWSTQEVEKALATSRNPKPMSVLKKDNLGSPKFSPEGDRILTRSLKNRFSPENGISIWDLAGKELAYIPIQKEVYKARYDASGDYIVTTHAKSITIWEKEEK